MNVLKSVVFLVVMIMTVVFVPMLAIADDLDGSGDYVSLAAPKGPNASIPPGHYGMIAKYADSYFSAGATTLPRPNSYRIVQWSTINPSDFFIIDARQNRTTGTSKGYCDGHLPTAHNIPIQFSAKVESLVQLPADNSKILVICYSGSSAAEVTTFLNLLGYNAFDLSGGIPNVPAALLVPGGDECSCAGDTPVWNGSTCSSCPAGTNWNGSQCL